MSSSETRTAWIDWEYDRGSADTGTRSRYGNYLRQARHLFDDILHYHDHPDAIAVDFAATAWRTGTGPVMAPGFVRFHRRVNNVALARSNWDGQMTAEVQLVSPRPQVFTYAKNSAGAYYHDYELGAWETYEPIGEDDVARRPYMFTELRVVWTMPPGTLSPLPRIPATDAGIFERSVADVTALVAALNREIDPLIEQLG